MNKNHELLATLFSDIVLRLFMILIILTSITYINTIGLDCLFGSCGSQYEADATITFEQYSQFDKKHVEVSVSQMNSSDYLIVKEQTENHPVTTNWVGEKPSEVDYVPNKSSYAAAVDSDDELMSSVLLHKGDKSTVHGLSEGDKVQVYGALDGSENIISIYEVE